MPFRKNGKDGTKEDLAKSFGLLTAPNGSAVLGSQDSQGRNLSYNVFPFSEAAQTQLLIPQVARLLRCSLVLLQKGQPA